MKNVTGAVGIVVVAIMLATNVVPAYAIPISTDYTTNVSQEQWEFYGKDLVERGIIKGYADGQLHLNENITRAETTVMLQRNFEQCIENEVDTFAGYIDVPEKSWYYPGIKWGTQVGLVKGVNSETGTFEPDSLITKEQIAVILYNYFKTYTYPELINDMGIAQIQVYTDSDKVSSWAKEAVEFCAKANILALNEAGEFNPTSPAKRGEFAEMVTKSNYINDDYLSHSIRN